MSVTITLYNTTSEPNAISKILDTGTGYTGTVRDSGELSVTDPVVMVSGAVDPTRNYMYISEFGRYYWITQKGYREGLTEISGHVDVLMSYQADILSLPAIAERAQTQNDQYSSYLYDKQQLCYAYKTICTRRLHTFSYDVTYILITAG